MNDKPLVNVTYQYRDILVSLIEALDTNNFSHLTSEIKRDLSVIDCQAKSIPELGKLT